MPLLVAALLFVIFPLYERCWAFRFGSKMLQQYSFGCLVYNKLSNPFSCNWKNRFDIFFANNFYDIVFFLVFFFYPPPCVLLLLSPAQLGNCFSINIVRKRWFSSCHFFYFVICLLTWAAILLHSTRHYTANTRRNSSFGKHHNTWKWKIYRANMLSSIHNSLFAFFFLIFNFARFYFAFHFASIQFWAYIYFLPTEFTHIAQVDIWFIFHDWYFFHIIFSSPRSAIFFPFLFIFLTFFFLFVICSLLYEISLQFLYTHILRYFSSSPSSCVLMKNKFRSINDGMINNPIPYKQHTYHTPIQIQIQTQTLDMDRLDHL